MQFCRVFHAAAAIKLIGSMVLGYPEIVHVGRATGPHSLEDTTDSPSSGARGDKVKGGAL